ncbi:MAG: Holliday junction resolvase RuvX [Planctomyces sp.]|nr:Holliday junction resolvase RuvX [Planctomyces sp.]
MNSSATARSLPVDDFPRAGCLLGVDYGQKRIGLAVTTSEQSMALPLDVYLRRNEQFDGIWLKTLCEDYRIAGLVVGLPLHTSGSESELSAEARQFGAWLAKLTRLPLRYWDERYTSVSAELLLWQDGIHKRPGSSAAGAKSSKKPGSPQSRQRKKESPSPVDKLAAKIILEAFLAAPDRNQWTPLQEPVSP